MALNRPNPAPNHHMIGSHTLAGFRFVNKNRGGAPRKAVATAAGSTTTLICTNADAADLIAFEKVRLFTSADVLKENKLFTLTNEQVDTPGAGSTTFTFTPEAAAATAEGDYVSNAQDISDMGDPGNYKDFASIDARLNALNSSLYTQARLNTMTLNDKIYALKLADDPELG